MHQAYPLTRQLYKEMRVAFGSAVRKTVAHQFRDKTDIIPHYLALWLGLYKLQAKQLQPEQVVASGMPDVHMHAFVAGSTLRIFLPSFTTTALLLWLSLVLPMDFNRLNEHLIGTQSGEILAKRPKLFCLNDGESANANMTETLRTLVVFYRKYFPRTPPWEQADALDVRSEIKDTPVNWFGLPNGPS